MPARALLPVHVGCSGWSYASWRERVYPPGLPERRWLEHYARSFETVEVNATFYRLVARETAARWAAETPPGFVFAVKASRYLTHVRRLGDIEDGVARFRERIAPLADVDRLGPLLWQLPETFRRDDARLGAALERIGPGRHAFEFRHPSWFAPDVFALLRAHGAALVIGDHPERPFRADIATGDWRYVRMHYGQRGRRGNYSQRELEAWAQRLHGWRRGAELFVYFNNDWEAFAPRNAAWLRRRLAALAAGRAAGRSS